MKEKLIEAVSVAYKYGFDQRGKRAETKNTVLAWCGYKYDKLPVPFTNTVYSAYKTGLYQRGLI